MAWHLGEIVVLRSLCFSRKAACSGTIHRLMPSLHSPNWRGKHHQSFCSQDLHLVRSHCTRICCALHNPLRAYGPGVSWDSLPHAMTKEWAVLGSSNALLRLLDAAALAFLRPQSKVRNQACPSGCCGRSYPRATPPVRPAACLTAPVSRPLPAASLGQFLPASA